MTLTGSFRLHWMLSVIPAEIVAHAVSVAVRTASSSVVPDATAQFSRLSNSMQTSQVYCCRPIDEYTKAAITKTMNAIAPITGLDMSLPRLIPEVVALGVSNTEEFGPRVSRLRDGSPECPADELPRISLRRFRAPGFDSRSMIARRASYLASITYRNPLDSRAEDRMDGVQIRSRGRWFQQMRREADPPFLL